jgi:hypothetical protein
MLLRAVNDYLVTSCSAAAEVEGEYAYGLSRAHATLLQPNSQLDSEPSNVVRALISTVTTLICLHNRLMI